MRFLSKPPSDKIGRRFLAFCSRAVSAVRSLLCGDHARKFGIRLGEAHKDDDDRENGEKNDLQDKISLGHRFQPDDRDKKQRSPILDDRKRFEHVDVFDKPELQVQNVDEKHQHQNDGEDLADDVKKLLQSLKQEKPFLGKVFGV